MAFTAVGGMVSMAAYGGPFAADGEGDNAGWTALNSAIPDDAAAGSSDEAVVSVVGALMPVVPESEPVGAPVDVDALVKSAGLAEERAAQAARQAAYERCVSGGSTFGGVRAAVAKVGNELRCKFDVDTVYGVAGRASSSDHPGGLALDLMVDRATGDKVAEYVAANRGRLGIEYVIYRQRINTGDGWERMPDRGGATANHMDHVHISFEG